MKKKIVWFSIIALLIAIGYLATLSDPPIDDSFKSINIESHLTKQEMINDIDTLILAFNKIHPNPYRFRKKKDLISKIDSIKDQLPDSLMIINFWRLVDQITIDYNDAHSTVKDRYILKDYVQKNQLFFPLSARIKDNKIYVLKDPHAEQLLPEGAIIKAINGRSDLELIRDLSKHATKETSSLKLKEISDDFGFYLWKTYDWNSRFTIHYKKADADILDSLVLNGVQWEQRKKIRNSESNSHIFKLINEDVGMMKITDFEGSEKEIKDFYKQSFATLIENDASHLIIDFRGHSGGADSYGEHLASYFADQPFRKLSKAYWKISPEFKEAFDRRFVPKSIRWFSPVYLINEYSQIFYGTEPNEVITVNYEMKMPRDKSEKFNGEVYLITDHNTFSAGSIFAEMFKYYKMGRIIGQPTGNLNSFNGFALSTTVLPNSKLSFQVSSVYNIANNQDEEKRSVEPDDLVKIDEDPLEYIMINYIRQ